VFNPFAQAILFNQGGKQGGERGLFELGAFPMPAEGQSTVRLGIHTCDVDADGDIDILYPIHEFGNDEIPDLYLNQGGLQGGEIGTFLLDDTFEARSGVYRKIASADIDGDGDVDIFLPMQGTFKPDTNPLEPYMLLSNVFTAPNPPLAFIRGDPNSDFTCNIIDVICILGYLFGGDTNPGCLAAMDVNEDDGIDITDPIALLSYLFAGGPPPPLPFPDFGDAAGELVLECESIRIVQ
jgi:hypothetical protein